MSLDLVILGNNDEPEEAVSIAVDLHHALVSSAMDAKLPLIASMSDYYVDAEFPLERLRELKREVQILERAVMSQPLVLAFLASLSGLIDRAQSSNKPILAIAD